MAQQLKLYRRKNGRFYIEEFETGKQRSLGTKDKAEAQRLFAIEVEAHNQPALNRRIARAYLSASDPISLSRTWQDVMDEIVGIKDNETQHRWETAIKDKALTSIRKLRVMETRAEHFLRVLRDGTVSTNTYLRRIHNFALDMSWLDQPVMAKRAWPKITHKAKRAITREEHQKIIARESNPERKAFYEVLWHTGASQSDIALLTDADIDWPTKTISFERLKLRWRRNTSPPKISIGPTLERVLRSLPSEGPLFPAASIARTERLNSNNVARDLKSKM